MGFRELQSSLPLGEYRLLEKAWYQWTFGPMKDYVISGNLLNMISGALGGKGSSLTTYYPDVFPEDKTPVKDGATTVSSFLSKL